MLSTAVLVLVLVLVIDARASNDSRCGWQPMPLRSQPAWKVGDHRFCAAFSSTSTKFVLTYLLLQTRKQLRILLADSDHVSSCPLACPLRCRAAQLAAAKMSHEKPGQTLQAAALVHEAYVRLVDVEKFQQWDGRGHFFCGRLGCFVDVLPGINPAAQRLA